jgi:hypothetical protein
MKQEQLCLGGALFDLVHLLTIFDTFDLQQTCGQAGAQGVTQTGWLHTAGGLVGGGTGTGITGAEKATLEYYFDISYINREKIEKYTI